MKHTYLLCAKIRIDGIIYEGYYTVDDYWVMNKNLSNVQYFFTLKDAKKQLAPMISLLKSKMCSSSLTKIYVKNDRDKIVDILWEDD